MDRSNRPDAPTHAYRLEVSIRPADDGEATSLAIARDKSVLHHFQAVALEAVHRREPGDRRALASRRFHSALFDDKLTLFDADLAVWKIA